MVAGISWGPEISSPDSRLLLPWTGYVTWARHHSFIPQICTEHVVCVRLY